MVRLRDNQQCTRRNTVQVRSVHWCLPSVEVSLR